MVFITDIREWVFCGKCQHKEKNYTYASRGNSFFHQTCSLVFIQIFPCLKNSHVRGGATVLQVFCKYFLILKKQSCEGSCHSIKLICSSCLVLLQNFQQDLLPVTEVVFLLFQFSVFRVKRASVRGFPCKRNFFTKAQGCKFLSFLDLDILYKPLGQTKLMSFL